MEAQAICADGYEICPSANRTAELGLDANECGNIDGMNKFYASLESSNGNGDCTNDDKYNNGTNDIWGCADMENLASGQGVKVWCSSGGCEGQNILCKNSLIALLSSADDWSNGAWSFDSGNSRNELITAKLSDSIYGGV